MRSARVVPAAIGAAAFALISLLAACDRGGSSPPVRTGPATIASLVPAATDLLIGMGARSRLVAVSTFDAHRPDVADLPRVGDYQTTDWETLSALDPTCMVIQIDPAHLPPGLAQRAAAQHTTLLNVTMNRLADVVPTLHQLGDALGISVDAPAAALTGRLDAVRSSVAHQPARPALLVIGDDATSVAGPGTFLDDLLRVAGGTNAAAALGKPWPELDREALLALRPAVVIVLVPSATPAVREAVAATWKRLIAGRPEEQVFVIDEWYALLPGWHVGDVAAQFAACLHGTALPAEVPMPTAVDQ